MKFLKMALLSTSLLKYSGIQKADFVRLSTHREDNFLKPINDLKLWLGSFWVVNILGSEFPSLSY